MYRWIRKINTRYISCITDATGTCRSSHASLATTLIYSAILLMQSFTNFTFWSFFWFYTFTMHSLWFSFVIVVVVVVVFFFNFYPHFSFDFISPLHLRFYSIFLYFFALFLYFHSVFHLIDAFFYFHLLYLVLIPPIFL